MEIVVLDGYTLNPGDLSWESMQQYGHVLVHDRIAHEPDKVLTHIGDAEVVFTNKTPLPATVLKQAPKLRYIGVLATGYNVVDVAAAKAQGITVTNVPTYGTQTVAQYTMGLLLALCHRIESHSQAVTSGRWAASPDFCFWDTPQVELAGKTMGIIGYGRIGQAVGKLAEAFGMKVLAAGRLDGNQEGRVPLSQLWAEADVVSLHCPLTPQTEGLVNASSIQHMKDGAILLNTARGGLVVEQDLCDALNSGKLGGAATDVASSEPIAPNNPLLKAKNCLITPHMAWASRAARARLMQVAADNLGAFLQGKPVNVVN